MINEQVKPLISKDFPLISNLSNVSAILNTLENINWAGFYLVQNNELVLGPFQGDVACFKIPFGKGVCGSAWKEKRTLIVDDVNAFKGHIACSSLSKSEIVTPIFKDGEVVAVIDIDAPIYSRFNEEIKEDLEKTAAILSTIF
jgi:L-methionine (R)-S-oxide reductase